MERTQSDNTIECANRHNIFEILANVCEKTYKDVPCSSTCNTKKLEMVKMFNNRRMVKYIFLCSYSELLSCSHQMEVNLYALTWKGVQDRLLGEKNKAVCQTKCLVWLNFCNRYTKTAHVCMHAHTLIFICT